MTDEEFFSYKLPAVTRILATVFGDEEFKNIPKSVLDTACERGSYVHKYIENTINNIDNGIVPLEYQIYIDYFYDWKNKHKPKFIFSEKKCVSKKYGYKGIIDTVFIEDTELIMCDWKTSSNLNLFKAKCQLNLYLLLLEDSYPEFKNKINKLKILSITKNGYKYYNFEVDKKLAKSILYIYEVMKDGE